MSEIDFKNLYLKAGRPVVIQNSPAIEVARRDWNFDYLVANQSEQEIMVEYYGDGSRHIPNERIKTTLGDYINLVQLHNNDNSEKYYLAEALLEKVLPKLKNDISIPEFIAKEKLISKLIFIGVDSLTSAHYHDSPVEVLLSQVVGKTYRKNKRPFHPSPTALDRS